MWLLRVILSQQVAGREHVPSLPRLGPTRGPGAGHEMRLPDILEPVRSQQPLPGDPTWDWGPPGPKGFVSGSSTGHTVSWPRRRNHPVL